MQTVKLTNIAGAEVTYFGPPRGEGSTSCAGCLLAERGTFADAEAHAASCDRSR
jgi:hypothetical protein